MIPVIVVLGLCLLAVLCLRTERKRKERLSAFTQRYIAHRGSFDKKKIPENSLAAFRKAMEHGYAVELDVRLTKDGIPVVFHDDTLERMCGVDKQVDSCSYEELLRYHLGETGEKIPTFSEVLREINGRVPVLVEIKAGKAPRQTATEAAELLDTYNGIYAVQSFHPGVLRWFRKNRPEVLRGQLSTNYRHDHMKSTVAQKIAGSDLWCNVVTCPDFISFRYTMTKLFAFRLMRCLYRPVTIAWTVRSKEELEKARTEFDGIIFDSFCPGEKEVK